MHASVEKEERTKKSPYYITVQLPFHREYEICLLSFCTTKQTQFSKMQLYRCRFKASYLTAWVNLGHKLYLDECPGSW